MSKVRHLRTHHVWFVLLSCALGALTLLSPLFSAASSTNAQTVVANADANVSEAHPNSTDGSDTTLRVDGTSPATNAYLRFDLSGVTGSIASATLRVYVENGHTGFDVHGVADSSWNESAITWSNAPSMGPSVGSSGPVDKDHWASVDVTQLVHAGGNVSFAITTPSSSPLTLASREEASDAPALVIQTAATAPADMTPPSISGQPIVGNTLSATPGQWTGTAPISVAYQWQRCSSTGANCGPIAGATASNYVVPAGDVGSTLRVAVTASNTAGSATATSPVTAVVTAPAASAAVAPSPLTPPVVSGIPQTGQTLSTTNGTWSGTTPLTYTYHWQRCNTNGSNCVDISGAANQTYTLTSADVGSTIRSRVTATNGAGSASQSSSPTATVKAAASTDTTAPAAPSGLAVGSKTQTSIALSWNPSTDNVGVTGYDLLVNGSKVGTTTSTSHTFTSLTCGTTYTLGVDAFDAAGNRSSVSSVVTATSACTDTSAPSVPSGLSIGSLTQTSIALSWNASTDNVGVTGYDLWVNGSKVGTTTSTSHTFTGLTCGTSYTLGVDAFDAAGNHSSVNSVVSATSACSDTTAPSAPSGLTVGSITQTSIALSWKVSTDNVGVTGYDVLVNGSKVGTTTSTGYTFSSLTCGTSYTLGVAAFDAAGNRSSVSTVPASTSACSDTTAPSVPSGLGLGSITQTSVTLSWNASTDNVGVSGYDLYVNSSKVGTTTSTSHTFSGLTCGTAYTLGVDAFDAAGNRSTTATVPATTAACSVSTGIQHVVWVVMENKQYGQIIGNTISAPYINQLAQTYGSATQMYAEAHPSLPNYIAMTSGSTQGITDDSGPSSHPLNVGNIFTQTGTNGRSLEESMPSNCYKGDSGNYAVRHNPGVYYTNYTQCGTQNVPLGSTPDLSATFTFITPNLCHDMHSNSCSGSSNTILQGDQWLQSFIPSLLNTSQYKAGNTVIFLTWDEDDYSSSNANHIPTIVISPTTSGIMSGTTFNHYSMLRTTEELLGITTFLGNAASAKSMRADFHL